MNTALGVNLKGNETALTYEPQKTLNSDETSRKFVADEQDVENIVAFDKTQPRQ